MWGKGDFVHAHSWVVYVTHTMWVCVGLLGHVCIVQMDMRAYQLVGSCH